MPLVDSFMEDERVHRQNLADAINSISADYKVDSFTRDVTTASGNQSITGLGFTPKAVIFLSAIPNTKFMSVGCWGRLSSGCFLDNGATTADTYTTNNGSFIFLRQSIVPDDAIGAPGTLDEDGFTIAWTKVGSPTGTAAITYLALR